MLEVDFQDGENLQECRRCLRFLGLVEDVEVEVDDASRDHLHVVPNHTNHLLELLKMLARMKLCADVAHIL